MKYLFNLVAMGAAIVASACHGQVIRVAGAAATTATAAPGAALSLYDTSSTTTVGAALQQGVHLGIRREASVGDSTLALGDSTVEMPLPSDLENTPRAFLARGLLLQNSQNGTTVFAGFTGEASTNTFLNSVVPSRFVSVVSSQAIFDQCTFSTLLTRGIHSNTLVSVSHENHSLWRVAVTAGRSDGQTILRALGTAQGPSYRFAVSQNIGDLQLQPSVGNQVASLERIGWNGMGSRSFGRHWTVDGSRHSYSTATAGQSSIYQGVTAARSTLLEGGATLHAGSLQLQGRVLSAVSGQQKSRGNIAAAAWTAQRWSLQATLLQSRVSGGAVAAGPGTTTSIGLRATQQVNGHLQLEGNASLGARSNSASLGGSWATDRFGLSVTHQQLFVPFGDRSGFHSSLLVSARLRLGGNETSASVTRAAGLPAVVLLSTDGYYGTLQDGAVPQQRPTRTPRYLLRGHVRTPAGEAVRGAAIRIGSTVVYTDSEGQFFARFNRDTALPVRLVPELFLSSEKFSDRSGELWSTPLRDGGDLLLTAELCPACARAVPDVASQAIDPALARPQNIVSRACIQLGRLTRRMFTWREHGRPVAA